MPTLKDLREHIDAMITREGEDATVAYAIWQPGDATQLAEDRGKVITQEQAEEAIEGMHHNHDCNYGMTWGHLEVEMDLNNLPDAPKGE